MAYFNKYGGIIANGSSQSKADFPPLLTHHAPVQALGKSHLQMFHTQLFLNFPDKTQLAQNTKT